MTPRAKWLCGVGALGAAVGLAWWASSRRRRSRAASSPALLEPPTVAARRARLMPAFRAAAARHGVPLTWLLALGRKETGFANLRSAPGARDDELGGSWGPLQVSSATAAALGFAPRAAPEARGRAILADPAQGVELGARYVAQLVGELGRDLPTIAAAYNAGPGRVRRGQVPERTRTRYVPEVLRYAAAYGHLQEGT